MDAQEAIRLTRAHVESQFPKSCSCCGQHFETLANYLQSTQHVGAPVSYDAERAAWAPTKPLGTFALANCSCGTTLSITSRGMSLNTMWRLLLWLRMESYHRGIDMGDLLAWVRDAIDRQVLAERAGRSR